MRKFIDETGKRYGRLVVVERKRPNEGGNAMFLCRCDCGKTCVVRGPNLRSGGTRSCGCLASEVTKERNKKHGFASRNKRERLHRVWEGIKERTTNPRHKSCKHYGARGISMCDLWLNDYPAFRSWARKNGYDENAKRGDCTIDRIDNNKGYSPENCRIANLFDQANNTRKNIIIKYSGKNLSVSQWARETKLKRSTIRNRLSRGWSVEQTLTTPVP